MIQWHRCNDLIRARSKSFATIGSIMHSTRDRRQCWVVADGDKNVENTSTVVVCRMPRMLQNSEAVNAHFTERGKLKYSRHFTSICGEKDGKAWARYTVCVVMQLQCKISSAHL